MEARSALHSAISDGRDIVECEAVLAEAIGQNLFAFFRSMLECESHLNEVARQSFLHDPGFDRFVLFYDDRLSWRLRLNVWWPSHIVKLRQSRNVHNHIWDHTSWILSGVMENRFFERVEGEEYFHCESAKRGTNQETYRVIGRCGLADSRRLCVRAGSTYHQRHVDLHCVVPQTDFLATLCFQTPPKQDRTHAIVSQLPSGNCPTKQALSSGEIRARITRILDFIMAKQERHHS